MNWEAIGAVSEIVGAIAVIATLIYLAIQVKDSARAARAASVTDATTAVQPFFKKYLLPILFLLPGLAWSLERDEWIEDLRQYENGIRELHIDPFNVISEEEFSQSLREIESELSATSDLEIIPELMRLTRRIGDGHTAIRVEGLHRFPVELYQMDGEWRVVGVHSEYAELLGSRIVSIDGRPMSEVAATVRLVAQNVENVYSEEIRLSQSVIVAEILSTLDLTAQEGVASFRYISEDAESQVMLSAVASREYFGATDFVRIETPEPAVRLASETGKDYLWFGMPHETDAVYIRFAGYPTFEEMEAFGEELLAYIDANEISKLVIDLRGNDGGDFFVGLTLAYYLNLANSIDWKDGVYVLIDKHTFSAAVSNAAQFRQILNAKIVGEPTGGNPVGYQDMGIFRLENSELIVSYSKRVFRFQDMSTEGIQPDVLIDYDWDSYVNGVDKILQWVINDL